MRRQTSAAVEQRLMRAAKKKATERYVLRLYVTGATPQSTLAILNVKRVCEEHLQGRYDLEVVDIYQKPSLAKDEQIVAAPTLIKQLPAPLRRLIGDLSSRERVLLGLDLKPRKESWRQRVLSANCWRRWTASGTSWMKRVRLCARS
jgi:circadian clock protein KaiB